MFQLSQTPGRTAVVRGKEYLFFSGYSYLGMNHVPEFIELIKEGIDKYGILHPSSRISNTTLDLFAEFEQKLAELTNAETAVCFSSGFLAGRAVMAALEWEGSYFYTAPGTHPAIGIDRSSIVAKTFEEWMSRVIAEINSMPTLSKPVIFCDAVNPLEARINDFSKLQQINKPVLVVIDDSHGIGVIGKNGNGIIDSLPESQNLAYCITYSLSKAYNLVGGAVSCTNALASKLRSCAYYTASTSIPPAFAYAFLKGQHLYKQQRFELRNNIGYFQDILGNRLTQHSDFPVFILNEKDEKKLEEDGIIISSFAYPDPAGKKINRIILNALHTKEDLEKLAEVLNRL
jgi:7-keto-8-aminopelargonate synthetase-like enzyme